MSLGWMFVLIRYLATYHRNRYVILVCTFFFSKLAWKNKAENVARNTLARGFVYEEINFENSSGTRAIKYNLVNGSARYSIFLVVSVYCKY